MGQTAYNEAKLAHQAHKYAASTSSKLGVRLCGCKYHDFQVNEDVFIDKYFGRDLDESGFRRVMCEVVKGGICESGARIRCLEGVVEKLGVLKQTVEGVAGMRFRGVSVLVVLEGQGMSGDVGVTMLDFARTVVLEGERSEDREMVVGINTLLELFGGILREYGGEDRGSY